MSNVEIQCSEVIIQNCPRKKYGDGTRFFARSTGADYSPVVVVQGIRNIYQEISRILIMSRSDICSLAYDGKFRELKEKIDLRPSLATTIDEVGEEW